MPNRFIVRTPEVLLSDMDNSSHPFFMGHPRGAFYWECVVDAETPEQAVAIGRHFFSLVPVKFGARWCDGDFEVSWSPGQMPPDGRDVNYACIHRDCLLVMICGGDGYAISAISPSGMAIVTHWFTTADLADALVIGKRLVDDYYAKPEEGGTEDVHAAN